MCVFELLTTGLCYLTANTSGLGFVLWEIITERVNTSTCFIPGFKCRNKHSFSDGFRHRDLGSDWINEIEDLLRKMVSAHLTLSLVLMNARGSRKWACSLDQRKWAVIKPLSHRSRMSGDFDEHVVFFVPLAETFIISQRRDRGSHQHQTIPTVTV